MSARAAQAPSRVKAAGDDPCITGPTETPETVYPGTLVLLRNLARWRMCALTDGRRDALVDKLWRGCSVTFSRIRHRRPRRSADSDDAGVPAHAVLAHTRPPSPRPIPLGSPRLDFAVPVELVLAIVDPEPAEPPFDWASRPGRPLIAMDPGDD
jgi:hypothetical protein